jgi:Resolvase, N terminal domain
MPRVRLLVHTGGKSRSCDSDMLPRTRPRVLAEPLRRRGGNGMRVALYGRVSTQNNQHPEMQMNELREFADRRGWKIVGEYVDEGISGARERRPQLDRLWADGRQSYLPSNDN